MSRDFDKASDPDDFDSKLNVNEHLIDNPDVLNENDYEVFGDDNREIIVVEKDQLYRDDPEYHDRKLLKEYNKQKVMQNEKYVTHSNSNGLII